MFKFLHAADLHLDSPLRGLDKFEGCPVAEIRGASRRAVENLVALAIAEKVQFVVIAGDVYDGEWKDHNTGLWFVARLAELRQAGIKVVTIKGNHDAESKIPLGLYLPDGVDELPVEKAGTIRFDDWNVAIHGQGFKTAKVLENLAENYPPAERHWFNIGLLHTCAGGRDGHERYSPCSIDTMRSKRFEYDYWALGHVHTRETLRDLHPHIAFPGNIQGRHIRESGPKGCLLVTVDTDNVPVVEFRPLDVLRWEVCRVDASDAEDGDAILDRFDGALRAILSKSDKDHLIAARVEIVGATQAHQTLVGKLDYWEAQIRSVSNDVGRGQVWVEKVRAKTTSPHLLELDAHALGSIEELVAVVDELRADPALLRSFVVRELDDLRRRLDRDIHATDDLLGLGDDEALLGLIESASPLILEKLNANPSAKS